MYKLNLSRKELSVIEDALILNRINCQQWPERYQNKIADTIALLEKVRTARYEED